MAPATRLSRSSAGSAMHFNCPLIYAALAGNTCSNIQATSSTPATARSPPRRRSPSVPSSGGLGKAAMAAHVDINTLPDDLLREILLRLDRLHSAAAVSSRWRRIVSSENFLKVFRERHPSSPLLGVFAYDLGRPLFHNLSNVPDLTAVVRHADTALAKVGTKGWCIKDCRNGRLLLSSKKSGLLIYNPLSQLLVPVPKRDDMDGRYVSHCLLDGNDTSSRQVQRPGKSAEAAVSFRVISVQQRGRHLNMQRNIRAVEYDPSMPKWRDHPWQSASALLIDHRQMPQWGGAMYAAGHIFWGYGDGSLVVLDTTTMRFSTLVLPATLSESSYAIGEIEDGMGCLVCLQVPKACTGIHMSLSSLEPRCLQVWLLEKGEADNICFKIKEEVYVSKFLGANASVWTVDSVINGLALLSRQECDDHHVVDLQSMTQKDVVKFRGNGYLYQMPWPPAGLKDAPSKPSSSNRMKDDAPTLSILDNTPDVNEGSGDEAAPCENHHSIKSPVNTTKTVEVENSKTHMNSAQHDPIENANLDLDGDSAGIQPVEMDPSNEPTLQTAAVLPFVSCNGAIQEEKSEIDNLPENTTEGAEMFEPQNCDMAHPQVSCPNKVSETKVVADSHYSDLPLLQKSSQLAMFNHFGWVYPYQMLWPPAIICGSTPPMENNGIDLDDGSARIQPEEMAHQSEAHDPNNEEPYGQRKKQKTDATRAVVSLNNCKTTLGHLDHHIPSPSRKSTDGDERSKPSSSNRIKDAPTLSILDNTPDVNEGSGDEVEPCENHHSLKSPVNRTKTVELENSKTHLNSAQHDPIENATLDLDGDSAGIQPEEMDPRHEEPTMQMARVFPSASCDEAILGDKSETSNLPMSTLEDAEMMEQQCSDKAQLEVSCADNVNEALYVNNTLRENTEKVLLESHCSNLALKNKSSEARKNLSAFPGTNKFAMRHDEQSTSKRQMAANSEDHLNGCNTYNEHINHQSEAHDPDEEPYRQRKKQKTNATSAVISLNKCKTTLGHLDHHIPSPSSCNVLVVERETISCRNSSMGQLPTTHDKPPNKGSSNCPQQGDPPRKSRRNEAAHHMGTRRTRSSHAVHGISSVEAVTTSTPAVSQTNLRGTCRNSSMGQPATQEKPLRKGKGLLHTCSHNGCGKKFKRTTHLNRHVKRKHTQSTEPFKCQLIGCTRVFHVKHAMEVNVKSHEVSTKKFKCPFGGCQSKFTWIKNLNRHFREIHEKPIPCTFEGCDQTFRRSDNLNTHVENMHKSRETPFMCRFEGCTEEFPNMHERKTHEKSGKHVEEETGKIKCHFEGCTYRCPVRQDHDRHYIKKHSKTSPSRGVSRRPRKEKT